MPESRACKQCGFPLPEGSAEEFCPRCLMEAGLRETLLDSDLDTLPVAEAPNAKLPDFGSYHAIGVLGEGGMGIVYLAEQREPIRRRVALKVLKHSDKRPGFLARFESERQALALMDH